MSTAFPSALDTSTTLYDLVNNAQAALSAGYTAGGTTLDLDSAALFPATGGIIYVGNERTTYTGKTSNQLTGVTALGSNYPSSTAVVMYLDAEHVEVLRDAIIAIETRVGVTGSTVAGTLTKRIADLEGAGGETITISNKTGAYTVVAGDLGSVINCTSGTFTVSLTAAATLGSGFNCWVWNTGTGVITIDPNSTETVDGVDPTTKFKLSQGTGVKLVCDGTGWYTGDFRAAGDASIGVLGTQIGRNSSGDMSVAKTGAGAVSLGGSYASGADSFAAANADSTGTYGAQGVNSVAMGYRAKAGSASGHTGNLALGYSASAVNDFAVAIGYTATASGINGRNLAIGAGATASVSYATAIGANSGGTGSQAVTGSGSMALGGSYASGADALAAAIANNTSSYGATGANSVALAYQAKASGSRSYAIGYQSTASGNDATALGFYCTASGAGSFAKGGQGFALATASGTYSCAWNDYAVAAQIGKYAYTSGYAFVAGGAQFGYMVVVKATTDATASVLTSDINAATTTNQVILPNNSAFAFDGLVVSRRQAAGGTESASWKVEGHIRRDANAASTTLVASTVTAISNVPGWTLALSADTTNGGLAVTFTGAAATNIRTVANIRTVEVTYA